MLLAHKIALDPNAAQRMYFARAAGVARFAWNWALTECQAQYKAGVKSSETALRKQLNAIKREHFPWIPSSTGIQMSNLIRRLQLRRQQDLSASERHNDVSTILVQLGTTAKPKQARWPLLLIISGLIASLIWTGLSGWLVIRLAMWLFS